jgi:hypothetical protein
MILPHVGPLKGELGRSWHEVRKPFSGSGEAGVHTPVCGSHADASHEILGNVKQNSCKSVETDYK